MKIKKGDKVYPIITGDDVIITKGVNHPGQTVDEAFEEVDDTLEQHKKDIDKLKSNMKYIYSYGGVGGNGRGGSGGGGGSTGNPVLFVSLNGRQLQNGGSAIVLNEPGTYTIEGNVSNSNGETFYVTVGYGNKIDFPEQFKLSTELNRCRFSTSVNLKNNGKVVVKFYDSEFTPLASIDQNYIVNPHTFSSRFMYEFDNGTGNIQESEFDPYEYFIGNNTYTNPFIDVVFKIDIPDVTNVSVQYSIGDTDGNGGNIPYDTPDPITSGQAVITYNSVTDITNNHLKIYLDNLIRNGVQFTNESNTGTYDVTVTLKYSANAEQVEASQTYKITLIPSYLYINVRNPQNLLYNSVQDLLNSMIDDIPSKYITVGTYTSFYCKIYEGPIKTAKKNYDVTFVSYDNLDPLTPDVFDDDPAMPPITEYGVVEQTEMSKPISTAFETPGIKKLVFSTVGQKTDDHSSERPVVKYIYVKESTNDINWYPEDIKQNDFYFKANQGANTYSVNFPTLSSGNTPLQISETDSPITISSAYWNPEQGYDSTIISFGMQYSVVNNDGAKILETYASSTIGSLQTPDIVLYSDKLFSNENKKICIPAESKFDKSVSSQYHLVQIVRYKIGYDSGNNAQYASYLYIDGKLESNEPILRENQLFVGKIVLNNVNVIYNLIDIQYVKIPYTDFATSSETYTLDGLIYQYYLAYKSIMHAGSVTESERVLYRYLSDIKFDGTNVIVPQSYLIGVSHWMPIPTMIMEYKSNDETVRAMFLEDLFKGYPNGDDSFNQKPITLYWCDGLKQDIPSAQINFEQPVNIPTITENGVTYSGDWYVELQGTSTMRNRIKNFSLVLGTRNTTGDKVLLMSPNYNAGDPNSFLPESIWTLKADIADSAHANNTAVGKFVNRNCTRFSNSNGMSLTEDIKPFIKNTLEGFPILMYFKVGEEIYYLGVYNFNMGRNSYYNLGYHTVEDTEDMIGDIVQEGPFYYSIGSGLVIPDLAIGEIQDNFAQFDFNQFDDTVLFQDDASSITKMFGKDSKITAANKGKAKNTLKRFVKSVAIAGAYCFANIGKEPVCGKSDENDDCVNRYDVAQIPGEDHKFIEYVPDVSWQYHYEGIGNNKVWERKDELKFETLKGNIENLLKCISAVGINPEDTHYDDLDWDLLDFTSASEYYTICMAFGLVDSILKNMNIKSWDGKKCYIAFYDMDCALGENNAGGENVSYLAATDYWHSNSSRGYVEPVDINFDYWNESVGKGFDFSSSYLFAIAKYAQAILNKSDVQLTLNNYPQQFWAKLRLSDGALRNTQYFIDNYFSSGIGKIPSYMASLNYQVKYLYRGTVLDDETGLPTDERYLANESAFNGTRIEKVKEWLNKRLHFLDVMFNVQGMGINIGGGYTIPMADSTTLSNLSSNTDIVVLSDAFSTPNSKSILMSNNAVPVDVYAPMNTPFIINRGSSNEIYLLCAGTDVANPIRITSTMSESFRFLGSKEFTNVSMVEPFLTSAYQIKSNNIEEIKYGGREIQPTSLNLVVESTSVKLIRLNIPTFTGTLTITNTDLNGQAIHTLDVSESGLAGSWRDLKNLKSLNISSVNNANGTIAVSNCPLVGELCSFSGTSEKPTTLQYLTVSGVSGKFILRNTRIQNIEFVASKNEDAEFEIYDDLLLKSLSLTGFKKIVIRGCPNIEELHITDTDQVCETIILDIPEYTNADGTPQRELIKFPTSDNIQNGVFDFTSFNNLKVLGVSGCGQAEVIKVPNHKVSIDSFKNNKKLEFVDTAGINSIIELTQDSTFYNCPRYGMMQSWWSPANGEVDIADYKTANQANKRTKMCVGESCTTLAHTFDKVDSTITTNYKDTNHCYTNEWGQLIYNKAILIQDGAWFLNDVVGGGLLDDAYLDHRQVENLEDPDVPLYKDFIVDAPATGVRRMGENRQAQIVSLQGCFYKQKGMSYSGNYITFPDLSGYDSLSDISIMYYDTNVKFMSKELLSLPDSNNDPSHDLFWAEFLGGSDLKMSKDAFTHISYRINGLSSMILTIYDPARNTQILETSETNRLNVVDILCPKYDSEDKIIPFTKITNFSSFAINPTQWVDYTELLEVCPNVTALNGFLNNIDLSKAKIDGMLKSCKNLDIIYDSFNHMGGDVNQMWGEGNQGIDLYEFFNWGDSALYGMHRLFDTSSRLDSGFSVKKYISHAHFVEIMNSLHNYTNISRLSNLFSYCTITDYDPTYTIQLSEDMENISNINSLFFMCKSGNGSPLKIRRAFFEHLPNVTSMVNTFYGTELNHMLSYDFFCKRIPYTDTSVYVKVGENTYEQAELQTYKYRTPEINDLYRCFYNVKFRNCKSWFDPEDVVDDDNHTNEYYTHLPYP